MTSSDRRLARAATLAVTGTFALLTLAACGGGGGGGPTSMMPPGGGDQTIPTRAATLTNSAAAANAATKIAEAAVAQPTPGSVTQSSNVDSSNITIDQVDITAQYGSGGPSFSIRNGTAWSIGTSDGNPRRISGTTPPWQGVELAKRIAGGTLYVDAYTDIEAPTSGISGQPVNVRAGDRFVVASEVVESEADFPVAGSLNGVAGTFDCPSGSCEYEIEFVTSDGMDIGTVLSASGVVFTPTATPASSDTDYLAGGVWLIVPDDATSAADFEFGAFADGSDPFTQSSLAPVMGTAIYRGDAAGVYSATEAGTTTVGYLDADVRLTANFGDANGLGTISGSMSNFFVDDEPYDGTLNLGTANIGAQDSGFFRGAVTGADNQRSYTGHWGGQFFGNGQADGRPGSVAGTFGAHSSDDAINFVGAFGAHKQ